MACGARERFMKEILLISTFLTIILFCSGEVEVTAASEKFKGTVFKYLNSRLYSFKGITYAQSSTSTRYRVARSVDRWTEQETLRLGSRCPSRRGNRMDQMLKLSYTDVSENCLNLNIYTPSLPGEKTPITSSTAEQLIYGTAPYPVLLAFDSTVYSSAFQPVELVVRERVVVVSANYRTAQLGYLCVGEAANLALKDQQLAMEWVNRYIEHFHGDKNRVTLLGVGDAAIDVNVHLLSKGPRLFQRAWISSHSILAPDAISTKPVQQSNGFLSKLGCNLEDSASSLECLRKVPLKDVTSYESGDDKALPWRPCADGRLLPRVPQMLYKEGKWRKDIDVVLGFPENSMYKPITPPLTWDHMIGSLDELLANLDIPLIKRKLLIEQVQHLYQDFSGTYNELFGDLLTEALVVTPLIRMANYHSVLPESSWGRTYVYEFAYRETDKKAPFSVNSVYGDDVTSMFGIPCMEMPNRTWTENDCLISQSMMNRLASFMRTGDPNSHATVFIWPKYEHHAGNTRVLSIRHPSHSRTIRDYKQPFVKFWSEHLYGSKDIRFEPVEENNTVENVVHTTPAPTAIEPEPVEDEAVRKKVGRVEAIVIKPEHVEKKDEL